MNLAPQEEEIVKKVQDFFSNEPGYVFEKVAGFGAYGVTLCYQNKNSGPRDFRKIAVKAVTWGSDDSSEIESLEPLKWAQHIVTMIQIPFQSKETAWIKYNTVITEYLENGTLNHLKTRLGETIQSRRKLPNRVLWAIFLCLTRACIGMAYPPGSRVRAPRGPKDQLLETIPGNANQYPPEKLVHGDLHEANIMLGDLDRDEHRRFPVLKLIDFGLARSAENSIEQNIAAIGHVMCELICERMDIERLVDDKRGANIRDPNLDSELLMLVRQCVDGSAASRPSLSRLLSVIRIKLRQTYPNIPEESDLYISELVQKHILDAD